MGTGTPESVTEDYTTMSPVLSPLDIKMDMDVKQEEQERVVGIFAYLSPFPRLFFSSSTSFSA